MGWVCTTRLIAETTAMAAKMRKISAVINLFRSQRHDQRSRQQIDHGQRKQSDPGEAHQLVVTETRQRRPHPNEQKKQYPRLTAEPEQRHQDHLQHPTEAPRTD